MLCHLRYRNLESEYVDITYVLRVMNEQLERWVTRILYGCLCCNSIFDCIERNAFTKKYLLKANALCLKLLLH